MIELSPTFCRLAWTSLATTQHGSCKLCVLVSDDRAIMDWSTTPRTVGWDADALGLIWNGGYMQDVRRRMLSGERVHDCDPCYQVESAGGTSNRQSTNLDDFYHAEGGYDIVSARQPVSLDLHIGNACNLTCHGCWGGNSSSLLSMRSKAIGMHEDGSLAMPSWLRAAWHGEINGLAKRKNFYSRTDEYVSGSVSLENFRLMAPTLRRLYVSGGEPTIGGNLRRYLDELSVAGNNGCYVGWSTNCTEWNEDLMDGLAPFDYGEIQLSIDAVGAANEYIRRPTIWDRVDSNVRRYMLDGRARSIRVFTVISALNVAVLEELLDYLRTMTDETSRRAIWWPIRLRSPDYQDIGVIDGDARRDIASRLESYMAAHGNGGNLDYADGLRGVIDQLRADGTRDAGRRRKQLIEYLDYSDRLDAIVHGRDGSWRRDLPHLEIFT